MRGGVTRNALHIDIIFTSWKKGLNNNIPLFQNLPKFLRLTKKWLLHQNVNVLMSSHTMLGNHAQYSDAAY